MVTATGIYNGLHTKVNKRKEDIVFIKKAENEGKIKEV